MNIRQRIIKKSVEILGSIPEGLRFSELSRRLKEELYDIKPNNIPATLVVIEGLAEGAIYKPAKGIFRHTKYQQDALSNAQIVTSDSLAKDVSEDSFYEPFARWLVEELEECTKAIKMGGSKFRDKWSTPDVIGVLKPKPTDLIKFPIEIVSAEIKTDVKELITAFGQACAYKIFSHKSYVVVPFNSSVDDISRLESLSLIFGIGLILFNPQNPTDPNFTIKTRAVTHQPDMFYVNKHMQIVADELL